MNDKAQMAAALRAMADAFHLWSDASLKYFGATPLSYGDKKLFALQSSKLAMRVVAVKDPLRKQVARLRSLQQAAFLVAAKYLPEFREAEARWGLRSKLVGIHGDLLTAISDVAAAIGSGEDPFKCWRHRLDGAAHHSEMVRAVDEVDRLAKLAEDEADPVLADLRRAINELRLKLKDEPQVEDVLRRVRW